MAAQVKKIRRIFMTFFREVGNGYNHRPLGDDSVSKWHPYKSDLDHSKVTYHRAPIGVSLHYLLKLYLKNHINSKKLHRSHD